MIEATKTCAKEALRRLKGRKGQSLVEYALILSFISVLAVALSSVLGVQIRGLFVMIVNAIEAARAGV
jgi:Flp pilus assembly pilin Flp